jgi:hypothetical protein
MAFDLSRFQTVAGASRARHAPVIHAYRTEDSAATAAGAGYFNGAATLLTPGDLIYRATINAGGSVVSAGWHVVLTVAGGVVAVSPSINLPLA